MGCDRALRHVGPSCDTPATHSKLRKEPPWGYSYTLERDGGGVASAPLIFRFPCFFLRFSFHTDLVPPSFNPRKSYIFRELLPPQHITIALVIPLSVAFWVWQGRLFPDPPIFASFDFLAFSFCDFPLRFCCFPRVFPGLGRECFLGVVFFGLSFYQKRESSGGLGMGRSMQGQVKIFWVGSQQFRESLRELLRESWFSHCSSLETPFRAWDFSFRELLPELRELLREYP